MSHVYASLGDLKNMITDSGATSLGTTNDTLLLGVLASVSETIDDRMERSGFGSGFGPRTGTNRYNGSGGSTLRLRDDLLTVTSITIRPSTASATTSTPAADTDYYLLDGEDGYGPAPYRKILLHGQGTITAFGSGLRVTDVAGTWGFQNVTVTSSATTSEALDTSETGVDVSSGAAFSPGQTILIDTEQMYISSIATNTLTVVRAANGTTAATHSTSAAIAVYQYPAKVREVCLRLALKRWKARDAGADGTDEGSGIPGTPREGEDTIIRRSLGLLRLKEMI